MPRADYHSSSVSVQDLPDGRTGAIIRVADSRGKTVAFAVVSERAEYEAATREFSADFKVSFPPSDVFFRS